MSGGISRLGTVTRARALAGSVFISKWLNDKWVNEKIPESDQILTAHDIARLTMRHHWMLSTLVILRKLLQNQRLRGRALGWKHCDITRWLAREHRTVNRSYQRRRPPAIFPQFISPQTSLRCQRSTRVELLACHSDRVSPDESRLEPP